MFGARPLASSTARVRREVQSMASHMQATGTAIRKQQKVAPSAHNTPLDELTQSVNSGIRAAATDAVTISGECGNASAVADQGATSMQALNGLQDAEAQQGAIPKCSGKTSSSTTGEAVAERPESWFGQRVWTRSTPLPAAKVASSNRASSLAAARSPGPAEGAAVFDTSSSTTASAQPQTSWSFSVMCYNILADTYAQHFASRLYRDVPRSCLDWSARRALLLAEIRHWSPDVVCLQEVQHFQDLLPEMRAAGYEGHFMRRTGRRRDGCATFWRSDRLRACSIQRLDFAPLGLEDNVAMLLSLAPRSEGPGAEAMDSTAASLLSDVRLLVATTHITFDPAKGDVKLGQVRTLLHRAAALAADPPPEEPRPRLGQAAAAGAAAAACQNLHSHQHQHQHHHQHQKQHHQHQHQHHHQDQKQEQDHYHQQEPADTVWPEEATTAEVRRQRKPAVQPAASSSSAAPVSPPKQSQDGMPQAATAVADPASATAAAAGPTEGAVRAPPRPLQTLAIITGDFNSTAGSPLYHYVARGSLDLAQTSRRKISGQLHGVCHTQYRPVAEVKQLHAQLTASAAGAPPAPDVDLPAVAATATAAAHAMTTAARELLEELPFARGSGGGPTPAAAPEAPSAAAAAAATVVVVSGASPPSTSPPTPKNPLPLWAPSSPPPPAPSHIPGALSAAAPANVVSVNGAAAAGEAMPVAVAQRLAAAAESVSAAAASAVAAAAAAAAHPPQAPPAARAAGANKVLDAFLSSVQRCGAERWTEKELRCAMGDQYSGSLGLRASVGFMSYSSVFDCHQHGGGGGGGNGYPQMLPSPSCRQFGATMTRLDGRSSGGAAAAAAAGAERKLGRHHVVPTANRYTADGSTPADAASIVGVDGSGRRSLELDPMAPSAADVDADGPGSYGELIVRHPLRLRSSYVQVANAEPAFTSIHSGFMGTVDFIWYTYNPILQQLKRGRGGACAAPGTGPGGAGHTVQQLQEQPLRHSRPNTASLGPDGTGEPVPAQPCACVGGEPASDCASAHQQLQHASTGVGGSDVRQPGSAVEAAVAGGAEGVGSGNSPRGGLFTLVPVAVLQPPDLEGLPRGLPSYGWGSDHISVMTQFELRLVQV